MSPSRYALCLALLSFGCSQASSDPSPRVTAESPSAPASRPANPSTQLQAWIPSGGSASGGTPVPTAPAAAPASHGEIRGTVSETMNAAGYTYLRMDSGGGDQWVATTAMPLAVGDRVIVEGGNVMRAFHSRTLDRTFDTILFAGTVRVVGASGATAPAPTAPAPTAPAPTAPAPEAVAPAPGTRHGTVRETMNSGGYTYLRVEGGGASAWVAVPETTIAVGDEVDVPPGNEMPGFHSRTLDRTFPQLTFASEVRVVGGAARAPSAPVAAHAPSALPPGHPPVGMEGLPPGHPSVGARPAPGGVSH
jgi:hypothetical protein